MFAGKSRRSMASSNRTSESFAVPLCLWQRAAFLSPSPFNSVTSTSSSVDGNGKGGGGGGGGREERDSIRLRLAQLHHEYLREIAKGTHPLHIQRLTQSLAEQYSTAMDCSEGADSIESPVKVLTSNHKKESGKWKSTMTVEALLAMPGVKAGERDEREEQLPLEIPPVAGDSNSHLQAVPLTRPPPNATSLPVTSSTAQATSSHRHSSQPYSHNPPRHPPSLPQKVSQFPYSSAQPSQVKRNGRSKLRGCGGEEEEEEEEEVTNSRWSGQRGYRGKRRRGNGRWEQGPRKRARRREEEEDEEEDEDMAPAPSSFVTARDQHVLNQHKKYGGGRLPQGQSATDGARFSQPHTTSYGCSKKSLGTRRAPDSKFVPPVRREDREGGGEGERGGGTSLDAVRARVQCGGSSSVSGGDRGLPPELEGDERLRNIEPRMVELIMNEIMDHSAPVQWDDIAGLQFAKATIKEIVVWPMLRPDIFTGLRGPPKGILLFGPPGTGKTLIGKCIASQVNATFFSISASSLTSKWIGEGEKMVRALFAVARCYQPAVIFMDEIDSLLSQRSDSEHESSRRIKTEFLVQLDGATTSADDRILIIGATNRPQEIDEAARRRLVKRLYIPLPDGPARKQIVTHLLRDQTYLMTPEELEELSTATDGYSGADMANLCREAAYGPVREAAETIQHIAADAMRPVLYKDFQAALHVIRASVSEQDLDVYVQWNKQFGCGKR